MASHDHVLLVLTSRRVQVVPSGQFTVGWSFWASLSGRLPPHLSLLSQDRVGTEARARLGRGWGSTGRAPQQSRRGPQPPGISR